MTWSTPRVFAIFLLGGTLLSILIVWLTVPLLRLVERPNESDLVVTGWLAALVLGLIWILPAQALNATAAALMFSFSKRMPLLFVLAFLIPVGVLIVTYRDILDCCDRIVPSDVKKLLYWTLVIAPAELLCAWYVSKTLHSPNDPRMPTEQS